MRARRLRTRRLSSVSFHHAAMQGEEPAAKRARPGGAAASSPSPVVSAEDSEGEHDASGDLLGGDEPVVARARVLIVRNKAPGGAGGQMICTVTRAACLRQSAAYESVTILDNINTSVK